MRIGRKTVYHGVLDIPEGTCGEYAIEHEHKKPGCLLTGTNRTTLFGQPIKKLHFDKPTRWHKLLGPTGTWMTDLPIEQVQHDRLLTGKQWKGSVLVGGLGLGYATTVLAIKYNIKRVLVVEKSKEVICLIADVMRDNIERLSNRFDKGKLEIIHQDLFVFLRETRERFQCAFYDIWQSDSEGTFFEMVVPLHELSNRVVRQEPICWNEDIMRAQLQMSLEHRILFTNPSAPKREDFKVPSREELSTERGSIWWDWMVPFWKSIGDREINGGKAQLLTQTYCSMYGRRAWRLEWEAIVPALLDDAG